VYFRHPEDPPALAFGLPSEKARLDMMQKGDFTAGVRLLWISALAIVIGVICAFVALVLLWLIGVFTHLFYFPAEFFDNLFHHPALLLRREDLSPAGSQLGWMMILVPAVGGLIIGLMARYGTDRIRGHGIPEAIEAILISRSRMSPKVAVLKPLSSAISIGSGGPFGAEGPIIMTGGAFGSIIAQAFRLTAAERKTLLVAGAAGGMSATFGTPVAAVLLAVELLLFEWKPRSLIPVALACFVAFLIRPYLIPFPKDPITGLPDPSLFYIKPHAPLGVSALLSSGGAGLLAGLMALGLTVAVYAWEDLFLRLPIHWMWWPAIGGLAVGVGGYFQPRALGVGYDVIRDLLDDKFAVMAILPLMVVKCWIWSTSLGSGTSGGVLAPLLIMGGSLGALLAHFLPGGDASLWVLVGMAAVMGGTMRSPLTGTIFALELTHDVNALPALLIASVVAHGFTVLVMKRSILTEKVARRGYHVSREYSVDPLELLSVEDVMTKDVVSVPASLSVKELLRQYFLGHEKRPHQAYPVVDEAGRILGVVTRTNLLEDWIADALADGDGQGPPGLDPIITYDLLHREPITAYPWESCRTAAERMAENGVGRLPVVSAEERGKVIGIVTRSDLLKPRAKSVEEEVRRERVIGARR
jgi:H+/Cl- antiporter ClcA/predicted transcriptional regulator